jgi:hypothetical protein
MNWYSYSVGVSGFNQSVGDMVEAENIGEAIKLIRSEIKSGQISVRRSYYGETDCDNFNFSGHIEHTNI